MKINEALSDYDNIAKTFVDSLSNRAFEKIAGDLFNQIKKQLYLVALCNSEVDYSKFFKCEGENIIFDTSHLKSILKGIVGEDYCKIKWFDVEVNGETALQEIDDRIMLILYAENTLKWKWDGRYHTPDGNIATPGELLDIYQELKNFVEETR